MRTKSKPVVQKPPADFEEVKRRFIRQNRELAKNNSSQSLRIRSLELEISRLLADNLELRNQVLHLQNEVYTAQSQASTAGIKRVKEELQAKIAELSGIVDGIEDTQETSDEHKWRERERKPLEGNWKERQPLTEPMRDIAMPTIMEHKLYPRRTLDAEETQAVRLSAHSSNESPDLGPPPVAHFDYEDPAKTASPLVNKTSPPAATTATGEEEFLPASFSVNLETRRKRKDGQPRLEIRRHSVIPQSPANGETETSSILRTGAKRKLSDRETEKPIKPPSKGDFTFSRKGVTEESKSASEAASRTSERAANVDRKDEAPPQSPKPTRRALADKSVNMSPRKIETRTDKLEKEKPEKQTAARLPSSRDSATSRRRRVSSIPLPAPQDEVIETSEIPQPVPPVTTSLEIGPNTPAASDLFSPVSSEPSTRLEGRGDTPPPGDLSSLSNTSDNGTRPSRRARSTAVNYAEPSLISKMRRPDKKMVDALTGLQDPRRAMNVSNEKRAASRGSSTIKKEPEDGEDSSWKDLPSATHISASSPLHQKGDPEPPAPPPLVEAIFSPPTTANNERQIPSASSATISALMAGSRKRRQSSSQEPLGTDIINATDVDAAARKLEELDLYEFKESSSPLTDDSSASAGRAGTRAQHRRHSSVPKAGDVVGIVNGTTASAPATGRLASRRRSMML